MRIIDITTECDDGKPHKRQPWSVRCIAVHRISLEGLSDPIAIARQFVDNPKVGKYTGMELPYTYLVMPVGDDVYQPLPMSDIGKHAVAWNWVAIGVGVVGDFRGAPPTKQQTDNLIELCTELCLAHDLDPLGTVERGDGNGSVVEVMALAGHDELPGGTTTPGKECPGDKLPMDWLRQMVSINIAIRARQRLLGYGAVL